MKTYICLVFLLVDSIIVVGTSSCQQPKLYDIDDGLGRLSQAFQYRLQKIDRIENDVNELKELLKLVQKGMEEEAQAQLQVSFGQVHSHENLYDMKGKFESLTRIQKPNQLPLYNYESIKQQIDITLEATDLTTRKDCCLMLSTMIESVISSLLQEKQVYFEQITIHIAGRMKIQILCGECDATRIDEQHDFDSSQKPIFQNESQNFEEQAEGNIHIGTFNDQSEKQKYSDTLFEGQGKGDMPEDYENFNFIMQPMPESSITLLTTRLGNQCVKGKNAIITLYNPEDSFQILVPYTNEIGFGYWFRSPDPTSKRHLYPNGRTISTLAPKNYEYHKQLSIFVDKIEFPNPYVTFNIQIFFQFPGVDPYPLVISKFYGPQRARDQWFYFHVNCVENLCKGSVSQPTGLLLMTLPEKMALSQGDLYFQLGVNNNNPYGQTSYPGQFSRVIVGRGASFPYNKFNPDYSNVLNKNILSCNPPDYQCLNEKGTLTLFQEPKQFNNQIGDDTVYEADFEQIYPESYGFGGWFYTNGNGNDGLAFRVGSKYLTYKLRDYVCEMCVLYKRSQYILRSYETANFQALEEYAQPTSLGFSAEAFKWQYLYVAYSHNKQQLIGKLFQCVYDTEYHTKTMGHLKFPIFEIVLHNDRFFPTNFVGYKANLQFFTCKGAFDLNFQPPEPPQLQPGQLNLQYEASPLNEENKVLHDEVQVVKQIINIQLDITTQLPIKTCLNGQPQVGDFSSSNSQNVNIAVTAEELGDAVEYGYGFWCRWLTRYPDVLLHGNDQENYFISRLTSNDPYDNGNMGDRLLAIWLDWAGYQFITNDVNNDGDYEVLNPNFAQLIPYDDIEGLWTYLYFSYKYGQAVGFVSAGGYFTRETVFNVVHPQPSFLRLVIGGSDLNLYPGFNGQIASPILRLGPGSFASNEGELYSNAINCNPIPEPDCQGQFESKILQGIKKISATQPDVNEHIRDFDQPFPNMYSIRGWLKWVDDTQQQPWHSVFRVTINNQATNNDYHLLGDRVLSVFINSFERSYFFFTYSYTTMRGDGDPNKQQSVFHQQQHTSWHYITFQYNRETREAYGSIKLNNDKLEAKFSNINHYLVPFFYIYVGKDKLYPAYNGYISDFTFATCLESYNPEFTPKSLLPTLDLTKLTFLFNQDAEDLQLTPEQIESYQNYDTLTREQNQVDYDTVVNAAFEDMNQTINIQNVSDLSVTTTIEIIDDTEVIVTKLDVPPEYKNESGEDNIDQSMIPRLIGQNQQRE